MNVRPGSLINAARQRVLELERDLTEGADLYSRRLVQELRIVRDNEMTRHDVLSLDYDDSLDDSGISF